MAVGRVAVRRAATRQQILDAAWDLARVEGIAGISLRDLAERVGMTAPSLYGYFANKHAIYDAMFESAYRDFRTQMADLQVDPDDVAGSLARSGHRFHGFCAADPARYQLMFHRSIPGFEPSPSSYAASLDAMADTRAAMAALGITEVSMVDLWISVISGLVAQQLANDPDGERWIALIDGAARMFQQYHQAHLDASEGKDRP